MQGWGWGARGGDGGRGVGSREDRLARVEDGTQAVEAVRPLQAFRPTQLVLVIRRHRLSRHTTTRHISLALLQNG